MATAPKPKPKTKPKAAPKPNAVEKLAQDITNRYRVTAREARDIVTAVGTAGLGIARDVKRDRRDFFTTPTVKNLKKQIAETKTAATTGQSGTSSEELKKIPAGRAIFQGKPRPKAIKPKGNKNDYKKQ
jgi:hypothetical protein